MSIRQWFYRNLYLKTSHWQKIAKMVKKRDGWRCQVKGCGKTYILDAHHVSYKIGFIPILFLERLFLYKLITLCREHHSATHGGFDLVLRGGKKLKAFNSPSL